MAAGEAPLRKVYLYKIKITGGLQMQTTMEKRLLTLAMVVVMMIIMAAPAFAESATSVVTNNTFVYDAERGADPNHGFIFYGSQDKSYALNQYTSASTTPAGTYLTTWKTTNHATQACTKKVSADGEYAFVCANNEWVAININRSNYSRANVYTLAGNYYADVAISTKVNSGRIILSVDGRGSYSSASLRVSSTATPTNDGNNTSKYCEWSRTGGTSFYEDDWISARSARLLIR